MHRERVGVHVGVNAVKYNLAKDTATQYTCISVVIHENWQQQILKAVCSIKEIILVVFCTSAGINILKWIKSVNTVSYDKHIMFIVFQGCHVLHALANCVKKITIRYIKPDIK